MININTYLLKFNNNISEYIYDRLYLYINKLIILKNDNICFIIIFILMDSLFCLLLIIYMIILLYN